MSVPSRGISRLSIECMRLLRKSDPSNYARLKTLYNSQLDDVDDIQDDDDVMNDFISDWYTGSDAHKEESFLQDEAKQKIYEGSDLSRLSATLLILNLQNHYGWSSASVTALFK